MMTKSMDSPYRDGLESELAATKLRVAAAEASLRYANGRIEEFEEKERKRRMTGVGKFSVAAMVVLMLLGAFGVMCLVLANNHSMTAAIGGGTLALTGLGIVGSGILAGNWGSIFKG